jgi:hypothetical protein
MTIDPAAQPPAPTRKPRSWKLPCLIIAIVLVLFAGGGLILCGGSIAAIFWGTTGPRVAAHDFIEALANNDIPKAKTLSQGFTDDDLDLGKTRVQAHGKFKDTTFNNTNISNSNAEVSGTAEFDTGTTRLEAKLTNSDGWKVTSFQIDPPTNPAE